MQIKLIIFATIVQFLLAATSIAESKVKISHLDGPLYLIEDEYFVKENSVFYVGSEAITIISASWTPAVAEEIVSNIKKISSKPIKYVVDTHYHADRSGGNAYYKSLGATIISTALTKELLKGTWANHLESLKKSWPSFPNIPLVLPDITFDKKYVLENGEIELLYFGPAHTKDGIVAYFPKQKILFGDCILKEQLGNLDSADLTEYPKTISKMKDLPIKTIIAGHWSPIHGPELIDKVLTLLKGLPKHDTTTNGLRDSTNEDHATK